MNPSDSAVERRASDQMPVVMRKVFTIYKYYISLIFYAITNI